MPYGAFMRWLRRVPDDARARERADLHLGEHVVHHVPELVEERLDLAMVEERGLPGLAGRRDVADNDRDDILAYLASQK